MSLFKKVSMKTCVLMLSTILVLATIVTSVTVFAKSSNNRIQNVILMIPDGMSLSATTLARFMQPDDPNVDEDKQTFTGRRRLAMDEHVQGLMRTAWHAGPITDSAPAATAMATGHKTNNLRIGVDSNDDPRATVMQAAKSIGMSTGLVMTSEFMHATPAAFMAHDSARFNYESLARQILAGRPNVVLGSGSAQVRSHNVFQTGLPESVYVSSRQARVIIADEDIAFDAEGYTILENIRHAPSSQFPLGQPVRLMSPAPYNFTLDSRGGRITTNNTWMQNVSSEGYQVVRTRTQMNALRRPTSSNANDLRVWGDFNGGLTMLGENHRYMSYDIDRRLRPDLDEPSLADMTRTAIDLLRTNRNGFFLLVEASKIDWAAHSHDTVAMMGDILAFDAAFQVALDFAKSCGNTILISATDHATGGLTIGSSDLGFGAGIGGDGMGPWDFDEAPWSKFYPLRHAVTSTGRSTEAALQLFVHPNLEGSRRRVNFSGSGHNWNDFASNHDDVMRAYGINIDFYDKMAEKTNQDIAEYLVENNIIDTVGQIRHVHSLIEGFRDAHRQPIPVLDAQGLRGNGMMNLSTAELMNAQRRLANIMNQIVYISWSTNWHAGDDVPFYMYAPRGFSHTELLGRRGNHIDNTDIAIIIANALRVCLQNLTDNLFVHVYDGSLEESHTSIRSGITVTMVENSGIFQSNIGREGVPDANNSSGWVHVTFELRRGNNVIRVTSNTNYFVLNDKRIQLYQGVIIYIFTRPQFENSAPFGGINEDTGKLFVPKQVIRALG